jgi:hypothetical protein
VLESPPNIPGAKSGGRSTGAVLEGKKTEAEGSSTPGAWSGLGTPVGGG